MNTPAPATKAPMLFKHQTAWTRHNIFTSSRKKKPKPFPISVLTLAILRTETVLRKQSKSSEMG